MAMLSLDMPQFPNRNPPPTAIMYVACDEPGQRPLLSPYLSLRVRYLNSIKMGDAEYRLRQQPMLGHVDPAMDGGYEFIVDAFAPHAVGRGKTDDEAVEDWKRTVHAEFQRMFSMRPFEMDVADQARWRAMEAMIDIAEYRRTTPIRMRQIGRVEYLRDRYPRAIRWIEGRRERINLESMPPEFSGYRLGQWIEAICERDPLTHRLLRISYVARIPEIRSMTPDEQADFLDTLPTSSDLPESDLDWTKAE